MSADFAASNFVAVSACAFSTEDSSLGRSGASWFCCVVLVPVSGMNVSMREEGGIVQVAHTWLCCCFRRIACVVRAVFRALALYARWRLYLGCRLDSCFVADVRQRFRCFIWGSHADMGVENVGGVSKLGQDWSSF